MNIKVRKNSHPPQTDPSLSISIHEFAKYNYDCDFKNSFTVKLFPRIQHWWGEAFPVQSSNLFLFLAFPFDPFHAL